MPYPMSPRVWYIALTSVPVTGLQTHPGALEYFSTVLSCCLSALLLKKWPQRSVSFQIITILILFQRAAYPGPSTLYFSFSEDTGSGFLKKQKLLEIFPLPLHWPLCCSVVSSCLPPHGLQHARLLCPSPSPGACSNSCPLSQWCHPTISSSVTPFSCPQSFPASGSFPVSWLFASGGQSIGTSASASVPPMNTHSTDHKGYQTCVTVFPPHSWCSSAGVWWSLAPL